MNNALRSSKAKFTDFSIRKMPRRAMLGDAMINQAEESDLKLDH